ncbi:hypothetical protein LZ32DRAFT_83971 [Colletotrichum eremochloae]|nr:hypothetical protein LZ32DRAFT_83971 [Colletotrichum eremochloae]
MSMSMPVAVSWMPVPVHSCPSETPQQSTWLFAVSSTRPSSKIRPQTPVTEAGPMPCVSPSVWALSCPPVCYRAFLLSGILRFVIMHTLRCSFNRICRVCRTAGLSFCSLSLTPSMFPFPFLLNVLRSLFLC